MLALFRKAGSRVLEEPWKNLGRVIGIPHVPASSCQAVFAIRKDGSPAALYFWDEVDWDAVDKSESRSLVLTDHNKMTDQVAAHFADRVKMA